MLDINFIRENQDLVRTSAKNKGIKLDLDTLIAVDAKRKDLQTRLDERREEQNKAAKEIGNAKEEDRANLIEKSSDIKKEVLELEAQLKPIMEQWQALMYQVPQIPHPDAPIGKDESENKEIKSWGKKPSFDFEPKDHIALMKDLDMVDFERGSKVHGFRGYFLKNDGALLSWAILHYAKDFFMKKGFQPMVAPAIVKKENLYGTGHLPGDEQDLFKTQDNDYLSGTAEVPVMGYFSNETLEFDKDGTIRVLAFSPCYRREAGSHGKDIKGLIRVHEFFKLEQLILCEADDEKIAELHQWLNRNTEEFIESLGIPYQTVDACTGDMGQGKVRMYDINLWVPKEEKYREISSASYYNDFQTRRFKIKYKDKDGNRKFAYSLNCTATATPRILVSLAENFQTKNGTIKVPKVLRKYLGKKEIKN